MEQYSPKRSVLPKAYKISIPKKEEQNKSEGKKMMVKYLDRILDSSHRPVETANSIVDYQSN